MEHEEMRDLFERLKNQWRMASEEWGDEDPQKQYFEREFWVEWENVVPPVIDALEELDQAIRGVDRDS